MWEATARIKERATKEGENGATQEEKAPSGHFLKVFGPSQSGRS